MYTTLAAACQHSTVVKNSEFLGFAAPTSSPEAALAWLAALRAARGDASHVAWAYKLFDQYRFSDDGEPSGTAGAPIYRALEGSGLECVVVAVVRYYGGVNLGAGGLVRAYGGTAAETLRLGQRLEVHPRVHAVVRAGFEYASAVYRILEAFDIAERMDAFTEHGLQVRVNLLETDMDALAVAVRDATRGQGAVALE
jgi:putative IMPACT (imprinted ancient) family translation regulator